ncbi:hypothetical protein N781_02250 [Pontibacillus halophilus JSM 076056 = DSM 19796]|uniref:phospholipase D n=1 Tax=Pontibacillus halophilus JSM 076056 = DSM 19796 TaxID=1385510 RepID=A0A0A5GS88_9BACI|nr:phospholipase D-like domain-containing protein [Pontibacillus halophilus]KGX94108.1 hypothetical protein N781_02250 [Pontibacillus halophilus JSM 076056 = DSM 19796]
MDILLASGGCLAAGIYIGYRLSTSRRKSKQTETLHVFFSRTSPSLKPSITDTISQAEATIEVATSLLTDRNIIGELCHASKRGVRVRVLVDRHQLTDDSDCIKLARLLHDYGVQIKTHQHEGTLNLSLLLCDKQQLLTGSPPFSRHAFQHNDEILFLCKESSAIHTCSRRFEEMWDEAVSYAFYSYK